MNYILKDHLGSIQYATDDQGNVVETLSFDPWGRRRNPVNWSYTGFPSSFLFDRGYTGHEHLDAFGLINMNGRMYDPVVSRFLSPDPFTQASHNLQGLNRYSYLMNNPMNGTDPTGYMRKPNRGGGGGSITGGGPVFDYFEFVPSIFDQIDESVKRRSAKYSALTYQE
jgi:RHS repeat-associated protein